MMKEIKVDLVVEYVQNFLPTKRYKNVKQRIVSEDYPFVVKQYQKDEVPLAAVIKSQGLENEADEKLYFVNNHFYIESKDDSFSSEKELQSLLQDKLWYIQPNVFVDGAVIFDDEKSIIVTDNQEPQIKKAQKILDDHIIVEDKIYKVTEEPGYIYDTFGLGGNHGGTGLFVGTNKMFSALERTEAIEITKKVALGRGDIKSIQILENAQMIKVILPEAFSFHRERMLLKGMPKGFNDERVFEIQQAYSIWQEFESPIQRFYAPFANKFEQIKLVKEPSEYGVKWYAQKLSDNNAKPFRLNFNPQDLSKGKYEAIADFYVAAGIGDLLVKKIEDWKKIYEEK